MVRLGATGGSHRAGAQEPGPVVFILMAFRFGLLAFACGSPKVFCVLGLVGLSRQAVFLVLSQEIPVAKHSQTS